ncbi:hypothetical protein ACFWDI_28365 [Streptomyces sp. NPDC060064]|uniref:hypothetical protein n=1 Tax=Streptomyces sp. NPDC060064 TaxID=3347049 RepID=UPI00368B27C7
MVDAWATPQQVIDVTGVTVDPQQLAQAQAAVEVFSNRIYADTTKIRTRDLYWLGRAVAWQAAWLQGQFDLTTRLDASSTSQDGVSSQYTADALVAAPMTARSLRRCSWMRSRTIHVRSPFESGSAVTNALAESQDDAQHWESMS